MKCISCGEIFSGPEPENGYVCVKCSKDRVINTCIKLKYENELDDLREFVEMVKWWAECEDFLFRGASRLKTNPWGEYMITRTHAERAVTNWLKEHGHDAVGATVKAN